ncbi:NADH-quinone oxidoreductase subunit G [Wolbachia endosymbiont of Brugia malayi]|uniref:NADH-quinone oxidoreductase subunit NuoG n=1 Tax=Wolbachia endosymbiont of Brugia malayi TaxID=80849 RepID=UPI00004C9385|nr:NADH-quinone oxidoreductase subunit NuoG [Wolbachia endosymbiont of Brugia malayi]AAW70964.1 NADH:ubiquinone oxidoreductase chain G [Wolbachia endosymbiont strain TRS of Brugia malayi]QCB61918.1 NADH-quinone oxidoreductase subunit G [Wolbachia endosymbiont of Brugia malayi]
MVKITINSQECEVKPGLTIIQACETVGVEIPRFCYHERLAIAGNCRMCLVEVKGGPPKPVASCAMPVAEGMVIYTDTPKVKKAREGVLEFLLINHPLDCPICDQGGECDLQDITVVYGKGNSRFDEHKRAIPKKHFGQLIEAAMNRCIHCTRCIRFLSDVAGTNELGGIGRGENMEISTYIKKHISSELSGNIIDLCPVGALTSKPYSFTARPWELSHCETIDVLDAVGSSIRVDYRGPEVMRILPRLNEEVNEEWISDKTRFAYDGLKVQRLDQPYIKRDNRLVPADWNEALTVAAKKLRSTKPNKIAAIAGDLADCESMLLLKEIMQKLGSSNIDCRQDGAKLIPNNRGSYVFNTTIEGIENVDLCLLINTNPKVEAPIINARIRKRYLQGNFPIASIGPDIEYLYHVEKLGNNPGVLNEIAKGNHKFCKLLSAAQNPMLIIGQDALTRDDSESILALAGAIAEKFNMVRNDWNGFNVLHKAAARVGGLDIGFVPKKDGKNINQILEQAESGEIEVVYLLGADEINTLKLENAFVIYQGHHGDRGAHMADIILPGAAYTEKYATYVNTEGRVQRAKLAVSPPGEAKEDWSIIKNLSQYLGLSLPYDSLFDVRKKLDAIGPQFRNTDQVVKNKWMSITCNEIKLSSVPFFLKECNFYMTDSISRASKIMANCTKAFYEHAS